MKTSRLPLFGALMAAQFSLVSALPAAATKAPADLDARLAQLPRPWEKTIHRLTLPEYEATLRYWAAQHPGLVTLEQRGQSHSGMSVYLLKITDAKVPDENKQVVMVSALHGGPERSGSTTALHLVEWLLGDSALAQETRRKQVVLVMPILNPHAFFVTCAYKPDVERSYGFEPPAAVQAQLQQRP